MMHLNSDVLVTLRLLHLHTDKNARDATFIKVTRRLAARVNWHPILRVDWPPKLAVSLHYVLLY